MSIVNMAWESMHLAGLPILLIGNLGIIALEGLLAFIQTARLHFYEFFSKFFGGTGLILLLLAIGYGVGPVWHYVQFHEVREDRIYRLLAVITFAVGGLMLVSVGLLANRIVAFIHGSYAPAKRGFWAGRFVVAAICCVFVGVLINTKPLYQYITERQIHEHWSYVALGAVLVLSGMQIFCFAVLEVILDKLWAAQQHRKILAEMNKSRSKSIRTMEE